MTERYRIVYERTVRQVVDFEIIAAHAEDAQIMAEKAFIHVPPSDWRIEAVDAPRLVGCSLVLRQAANE